jgi:hypothetical protein
MWEKEVKFWKWGVYLDKRNNYNYEVLFIYVQTNTIFGCNY